MLYGKKTIAMMIGSRNIKMFDKSFSLIIMHEGGYVNNPKDPGGETNFGISKRSYPDVDIKNLTSIKAKEIYKKDYWDKVQGDELPFPLNSVVFDMAVNAGKSVAVKLLQKSVQVKVDGDLGPITLAACYSKALSSTVNEYTARRILFYQGLKNFKYFGLGWTRRTIKTHSFCMTNLERIDHKIEKSFPLG